MIGAIQFFEPRKDTAELLDFVHKTFHQMAFPIQPSVVLAHEVGTLVRGNNGLNTPIEQIIDEIVSGIPPIRS
jgi:hypothetical protein